MNGLLGSVDVSALARGAVQCGIFVTGAAAVWMVGRPVGHSLRRVGFLVGLAGQPLWLWETIRAGQHGMLALSAWYCWAWWSGWRNNAPMGAEESVE